MTGKKLTLEQQLEIVQDLLRNDPSGALWDVLTASRGPDTPSERGNMTDEEYQRAYRARRNRKYKTIEVIRDKAFGNTAPGARRHKDDKVILPADKSTWDHFDSHVQRAANRLGLRIEYEG